MRVKACSAVLMVEIPQFENSVYLVEVRYPTHNRGGFILGLDDFYEEASARLAAHLDNPIRCEQCTKTASQRRVHHRPRCRRVGPRRRVERLAGRLRQGA